MQKYENSWQTPGVHKMVDIPEAKRKNKTVTD